MRENSGVTIAETGAAYRLGVMLGAGALTLVSGCLHPDNNGWGNQRAARDPDPNSSYLASYESYTPTEDDPAVYRPVPKADLDAEEVSEAGDGTEDPVNAFLARVNAATLRSDKTAPTAYEQPVRKRKKSEGIPWRGNQPVKPIALDRNPDDSKTFALKPRPKERALPYEAKHRESVTAPPSVGSVGVSNRNMNTTQIVNANPARLNPSNSNVRVQQGMDLNELSNSHDLQALIDLAHSELQADPSNASKQLRLSLLHLANNQPRAAAQLSPTLNSHERELIAQFVASIGQVGSQLSDPMLNSDAVLASIEDLRTSMRSTAALSVPTVALCSRVTTFGIYDELPDDALRGNRVNRAIVYCEVDHFTSTFDAAKNQYRTELSSRLEVFTADGRSVWSQTEEKISDYSRQRREDFFLAQLITLPNDVRAGEYVLKVAITDLLASKTTEAVHRFTIK